MGFRQLVFFLIALCVVWSSVALACSFSSPIWSPDNTADPLYRFVRDGKAGYIDATGKVVISPTFKDNHENLLDSFHDGRLAIDFGRAGYVDAKGRKVIDKKFDSGGDFSEGLAMVRLTREGRLGYIDLGGKVVIPAQFEEADSFSEGVASVLVKERAGFIDKEGTLVIKPVFLRARSFHEGRAWVVAEGPCHRFHLGSDGLMTAPPCEYAFLPASLELSRTADPLENLIPCKYAMIDPTGTVISKNRFDDVGDFSEGLAPVKSGTQWGYVDRTGAVVIEPRFDYAYPFSEGRGMVSVRTADSSGRALIGYIDRSGGYAIKPQFELAESFSDGLAAVGNDSGPFWYIDHEGRSAISTKFMLAGSFVKGLAHVKLFPPGVLTGTSFDGSRNQGRFAYINRAGATIFTYQR
jgi:hypothetical protein